jgi:hypothetical protein
MGLFSSKSSSSSNVSNITNTTNTTDNSITDNRTVIQNDVSFDSINSALRTAGDAISQSLGVVDRSNADSARLASDTVRNTLDFANSSNRQVSDFGSNAISQVRSTSKDALKTVKDFTSQILTTQTSGGQNVDAIRILAFGSIATALFLVFKK